MRGSKLLPTVQPPGGQLVNGCNCRCNCNCTCYVTRRGSATAKAPSDAVEPRPAVLLTQRRHESRMRKRGVSCCLSPSTDAPPWYCWHRTLAAQGLACAVTGAPPGNGLKNTQKNRSDIPLDPGGHPPQCPCALGRYTALRSATPRLGPQPQPPDAQNADSGPAFSPVDELHGAHAARVHACRVRCDQPLPGGWRQPAGWQPERQPERQLERQLLSRCFECVCNGRWGSYGRRARGVG